VHGDAIVFFTAIERLAPFVAIARDTPNNAEATGIPFLLK
jgi:hypothetical protein